MALFIYQARTAQGELQKGRSEGATSAEVADQLVPGLDAEVEHRPVGHDALPGGHGGHAVPVRGARAHRPGHRGVAPHEVEEKIYPSTEAAYHGVFLRRVQDLLET